MTRAEAEGLIRGGRHYYRVHFERIEGGMLIGDFVPERWEQAFTTEVDAWAFAQRLANAMVGRACNFYVIDALSFAPVEGYKDRMIRNR